MTTVGVYVALLDHRVRSHGPETQDGPAGVRSSSSQAVQEAFGFRSPSADEISNQKEGVSVSRLPGMPGRMATHPDVIIRTAEVVR